MGPTVREGAKQQLIAALGNDRARDGGRALVMLDREGGRELVDGVAANGVQELVAPAGGAKVAAAPAARFLGGT
jgi:hypothetical protein